MEDRVNPKTLGSGVLSILWCLFSVACGGPDTPSTVADNTHSVPSPTGSPSRIETLLVTASPSAASLTLSARVTFAENWFAKISSPLQGRVLDVRVKLGQPVKAGDVLLVVDTPDIATAYSDYVKEISELSLAKRNYELALDLYRDKAVPLKELKQAENDFNREKAEFRQAKERLLTLRVPAAELEKPLEQQIISSRFELKSPLTGTVVERSVTPGQLVGGDATQVLFTVADLDKLQVVADVYERDIDVITIGQETTATVEAWPGEQFPANRRCGGSRHADHQGASLDQQCQTEAQTRDVRPAHHPDGRPEAGHPDSPTGRGRGGWGEPGVCGSDPGAL